MAELDENDEIFDLKQLSYETDTQFDYRSKIYNKVLEDTKSKKKAQIITNIWINILSLHCSYSDEVMKQIVKYKPEYNLYDVKIK